MFIRVYRYTGNLTRSLLRAEVVAEIESDEPPDDPDEIRAQYDGDFIEIIDDEPPAT